MPMPIQKSYRYMSSPPVFSEVRVTQSLVLCVSFVDRYLSCFPFFFGHCVVCPSADMEPYCFCFALNYLYPAMCIL
jgi:hypothetical protein